MPHAKVNGVELHYERAGRGPPVVFAAGLGGRGSYWSALAADLAREFDVITFDHRGVGRSGPAQPPFSVAGLARDVLGLLDALGIARAAYVGHSMGGAMGQWLAVRHGGRLSAMVLGATWRRADARFRALMEGRKETLSALGPEGYVRHSLPLLYPTDWFAAQGDGLQARIAAEAALLPPAPVLAARIDALLASDHGEGLDRIALPVLVAYAADDCLVPPAHGRELARAIPGAAARRFATGGHHFPLTRGRAYTRAIRAFLARAQRSPP